MDRKDATVGKRVVWFKDRRRYDATVVSTTASRARVLVDGEDEPRVVGLACLDVPRAALPRSGVGSEMLLARGF